MIIITQDGFSQVNFDNVTQINLTFVYADKARISAEFTNNTQVTLGWYSDPELAKEVFQDLLLDYHGSAVIEMPQDKKEPPCYSRNGPKSITY